MSEFSIQLGRLPSLINIRQNKLIYLDILVTGRLVSWTSGPLYSDVNIADTVRIAQIYYLTVAVPKVQLEFIA